MQTKGMPKQKFRAFLYMHIKEVCSDGGIEMKKLAAETRLCAVFVDYDNIYLSLRRQDELAAKQFPVAHRTCRHAAIGNRSLCHGAPRAGVD